MNIDKAIAVVGVSAFFGLMIALCVVGLAALWGNDFVAKCALSGAVIAVTVLVACLAVDGAGGRK